MNINVTDRVGNLFVVRMRPDQPLQLVIRSYKERHGCNLHLGLLLNNKLLDTTKSADDLNLRDGINLEVVQLITFYVCDNTNVKELTCAYNKPISELADKFGMLTPQQLGLEEGQIISV